ncbi:MAG TPA: VanZ family protein [Candidatus Cloacimonadota bacterium]|nr:VanZ family protein [Candidatus Cloacimonadota bacterium]
MKKIRTYSAGTNAILYSLLLIATPFLIIKNYLQQIIGMTSRLTFSFLNLDIPYILAIAAFILIALFVIFRHRLKLIHLYVGSVVIALMFIGQNSTDYYFNHRFYELQHNWHYLAYSLYAFVIYRYLKQKDKPAARIILTTFILALSTSCFDEAAQIVISSRVFDICDIGKDIWGAVIGMIAVFFVFERKTMLAKGWRLRQKSIADYPKNPLSLLFLEMILAYLILLISSILSDDRFIITVILFSLAAFLIFFFFFHFSQRKIFRRIFLTLLVVFILLQTISFIRYHDDNIVFHKKGLIVYKGIPIPYFDVMIFPDGNFRLVDKKIFFNQKDKINRIFQYAKDILLIGSGTEGEGGKGFIDENQETQFVYNQVQKQLLQIIVLKNTEACSEYNYLKKQGYNVMFIIHN